MILKSFIIVNIFFQNNFSEISIHEMAKTGNVRLSCQLSEQISMYYSVSFFYIYTLYTDNIRESFLLYFDDNVTSLQLYSALFFILSIPFFLFVSFFLEVFFLTTKKLLASSFSFQNLGISFTTTSESLRKCVSIKPCVRPFSKVLFFLIFLSLQLLFFF